MQTKDTAGIAWQELARHDFEHFFAILFSLLNPGAKIARHQRFICKTMDAVFKGEQKKLMLSAPPGHAKSSIISVYGPAFVFGMNPAEEVIATSYSSSLASGFGKKVRRLMSTPEYKAIFPKTVIEGTGEAGSEWSTTAGGTYLAVGRGGSITGKRASLILCDDYLKNAQEASSPTILGMLPEWWDTVLSSRGYPWCRTVLIATRWSQDDLHGYLQNKEPDEWLQLNFPAICDNPESDLLGRALGDALWPDFYPAEKLNKIRSRNKQAFEALYQGSPVVKEGNVIDLSSLRASQNAWQTPEYATLRVLSLDTAEKAGISHDESYITFWLYDLQTGKARLEFAQHGRWTFPDLVSATTTAIDSFEPDAVLVEDASSGTQLLQLLDTRAEAKRRLHACPARPSLQVRFASLCQFIAEGKMSFDSQGNGVAEVLQQFASYPFASHDDAVASATIFVRWLEANKELLWTYKNAMQRQITQMRWHGRSHGKTNRQRTYSRKQSMP